MIWKKDRLRPTQPYFVLESENFKQEVYLKQGISHFYTFRMKEAKQLHAVPDGCIDFFFEYTDHGIEAYVCGTPLRFRTQEWQGNRDVFGVRFMPGMQPKLITVKLKDLIDKKIPLEDVILDRSLIPLMEEQEDFYQRIRIFLQQYTKMQNQPEKYSEKRELLWSVKQMVYESDGKVKIAQMQEKTGYTVRYINKVFIDEMGFPPKTFCKIIQFQRALEFLNYGAPDKMTDAAVYLGYYDQPQFIRDFKAYCGVTPLKYLKMVEEHTYKKQIQETNLLHTEQE